MRGRSISTTIASHHRTVRRRATGRTPCGAFRSSSVSRSSVSSTRFVARVSSKTRREDDGDDGGWCGAKMRGRWCGARGVSKAKDAWTTTVGWRRVSARAGANGDAVGESGVAVDGERIVVRKKRSEATTNGNGNRIDRRRVSIERSE